MQTVIGLGEAGCKIAEELAQYPQYTVLKIDADDVPKDRKLKNTLTLKRRPTPEAYEKAGSLRFKTKHSSSLVAETCQRYRYASWST